MRNIKKLSKLRLRFRNDAFTLIEMLVVLTLITSLLLFTIKPASNLTTVYQEKNFWNKLKYTWNQEFTLISQRKEWGNIKFEKDKITFYEQNRILATIKLPKTLYVFSFKQISISETGQVKGTTVLINSTDEKHHYKIVVQVGWGKYYVKQNEQVGIRLGRNDHRTKFILSGNNFFV
ncbi:prepilin-type N-terminal cleavage/methylation domain-containing protein [Liquorilactobacillus vini]|nr:prepilin-type N-terminal cleavage/methylation domain-containing protein [Liquorilactobacillus vini]